MSAVPYWIQLRRTMTETRQVPRSALSELITWFFDSRHDRILDRLRSAEPVDARKHHILVVTFLARLARLALLPLARVALAHQRAMQKIQPELDALRGRYQRNPKRLAGFVVQRRAQAAV
jgi:membrane protein insertase Oxa1/YidC/SpoIIIJ